MRGLRRLGLRFAVIAAAYAFTNAEAEALVERMASAPNDDRKELIDTLVGALKTAGSWTKLDALYVTAAHDSQAAKLNWIADQYNITDPGTTNPTFTADRGFTGDGTTDYLSTNFDPTTAPSPKYTLNSSCMGVWCGTDSTNAAHNDIGAINNRINARSAATTPRTRANDGTNGAPALNLTTAIGFTFWSRTASGSYLASKNGETAVSVVVASTSISVGVMGLLGSGVPAISFSPRRLQAALFGSGLSDAERIATYNALAAYMTGVGA